MGINVDFDRLISLAQGFSECEQKVKQNQELQKAIKLTEEKKGTYKELTKNLFKDFGCSEDVKRALKTQIKPDGDFESSKACQKVEDIAKKIGMNRDIVRKDVQIENRIMMVADAGVAYENARNATRKFPEYKKQNEGDADGLRDIRKTFKELIKVEFALFAIKLLISGMLSKHDQQVEKFVRTLDDGYRITHNNTPLDKSLVKLANKVLMLPLAENKSINNLENKH